MSVKSAVMEFMGKAIAAAPDKWMPGGTPDPLLTQHKHGSKGDYVGAPVSRIDGPLKVRGAAPFAAEFPVTGMLYAAVAYSTIARGRITALDTAAAEAAPGVQLVLTYKNAPKLKPTPTFNSSPKAAGPDDLPIMQDDQIHWNGQAVAVVLADTQEEADYAKSLLKVSYATEPARTRFEEALQKPRELDVIMMDSARIEIGDAEAALAAAPHRIDHIYRTPRYNHNAIELHAVTLFWDDGDLYIHDASQGVTSCAWTMAQAFGIDEKQVHVSSPYVGGGFGGKTLWHHHVLAAAASQLSGRPVRMVLSREGVYRTIGGRTLTQQRVALGAGSDGRFLSLIHTGTTAMTEHNNVPEQFSFPARHAYQAENFSIGQNVADMDMVANTFMRAPGESVGTFALECGVDELAIELGIDPVELRLRNEPEKDPTSGKEFSSCNVEKMFRDGAERFGWSARNTVPGTRREGEWLVGMGCAEGTYPYYRMPGGKARLTLSSDGRATAAFAAHEMGMGTATVQAQVVADRLGLDLHCVDISYGNSALEGNIIAGGSQQTASIGASILAAHKELVTALIKLAGKDSPLHGLKAEDVETREGGIWSIAEPSRGETYAAIFHRSEEERVSVEGAAPPPLEIMHWSMHSFSAVFAEVRVNSITGEVRVNRLLGSFDCGRILNSKTAASQFRGGMIMGVGLALMEETEWDERNGRIMNPSLAEYHVPVHMDIPEIEVMWTDIPDPHSPMGAHGVGEIGITGVAAAIANAVFNACGKRVRELPITLDKLM